MSMLNNLHAYALSHVQSITMHTIHTCTYIIRAREYGIVKLNRILIASDKASCCIFNSPLYS